MGKADEEREVFEEFATAARLAIDPGSIRSEAPDGRTCGLCYYPASQQPEVFEERPSLVGDELKAFALRLEALLLLQEEEKLLELGDSSDLLAELAIPMGCPPVGL